MARQRDADTATGQFYFNTVDNAFLDGTAAGVDGYAVFGKIITGLDVMDKIRVVPTKFVTAELSQVPVTPVVITSVTQTQ